MVEMVGGESFHFAYMDPRRVNFIKTAERIVSTDPEKTSHVG